MKVAAYQAPLLAVGSMDALQLIRQRVKWCESEGIEILCCPEAILGGLADYAKHPNEFAIPTHEQKVVRFTTLQLSYTVGRFLACIGNCIRRSTDLFTKLAATFLKVGDLTFGIVICYDSNYPELARRLAVQGASALFIPTNNGLPPDKAYSELVIEARKVDIANAIENRMWVIRADVTGRTDELLSYGSSSIVDPNDMVVNSALALNEDLLSGIVVAV